MESHTRFARHFGIMSGMQVTRKQFIAGSSLFGVATAMRLNAAGSATPTFRPEDYAEFRRGLRATDLP